MQTLNKHNIFIVVHGDKKLGSGILEDTQSIYKGCWEHLGKEENYKQISKERTHNMQLGLQYQFKA